MASQIRDLKLSFYDAIRAGDEARVTALLEGGLNPWTLIIRKDDESGEVEVLFPLEVALQAKKTKIAQIIRTAIKANPRPPDLWEEFMAIKFLGHLLGVPGKVALTDPSTQETTEVFTSGTTDHFAFILLTPVLKSYLSKLPENSEVRSDFQEILEAFESGLEFVSLEEDYTTGVSKQLARFKQHQIVVLPSGNDQHSVGVGLYKNKLGQAHLVFSNRGLGKEYEQGGTLVYPIKEPSDNFVTEKFLLDLFTANENADIKVCLDLIQSVVVNDPIILPSKAQELGNCAVVNKKSLQEGFLFLREQERIAMKDHVQKGRDLKGQLETKLVQESTAIEQAREYAEKTYKPGTQGYRDVVVDLFLEKYQAAVGNVAKQPNDVTAKKVKEFYLNLLYKIILEHHGKEKHPLFGRKIGRAPKVKAELKRVERILRSISEKDRIEMLEKLETEGVTVSLAVSAKKYGEDTLLKILMESGTPLMHKILKSNDAEFQKLIPEMSPQEIHAILLSCIENINFSLVKKVLASPHAATLLDKRDLQGNTALFKAVNLWSKSTVEGNKLKSDKREELFEIIQALIKLGANPSMRGEWASRLPWLKNKSGKVTPLHLMVLDYAAASKDERTKNDCLALIKLLASEGVELEDLKESDFSMKIPRDFEFTQSILTAKNLVQILNFHVFDESSKILIFHELYNMCFKDERYLDLMKTCMISGVDLTALHNKYDTFLTRTISVGDVSLLKILLSHPQISDFINRKVVNPDLPAALAIELPLEIVEDLMRNPEHRKLSDEMFNMILAVGADPFMPVARDTRKKGLYSTKEESILERANREGNKHFVESVLSSNFSVSLVTKYKKEFYPSYCTREDFPNNEAFQNWQEERLYYNPSGSFEFDDSTELAVERLQALSPASSVISAKPSEDLIKLTLNFLKSEKQLEEMTNELENLVSNYQSSEISPPEKAKIRLKLLILNNIFENFRSEKLRKEKMESMISELGISQGPTLEAAKKMIIEKYNIALSKAEARWKVMHEIIGPVVRIKTQPGS